MHEPAPELCATQVEMPQSIARDFYMDLANRNWSAAYTRCF